jgi:GH18 family chitinase
LLGVYDVPVAVRHDFETHQPDDGRRVRRWESATPTQTLRTCRTMAQPAYSRTSFMPLPRRSRIALVQFKQLHPNLKVLISIGGWNPPTYKQLFDTAASKQAQRQAFVGSCINMFIQGNIASDVSSGTVFDGFDIDWEFPNANDTANFTALMTEFRNELTTLSGTTGKTYLVLADLAAGPSAPAARQGFQCSCDRQHIVLQKYDAKV